jgi:hypothetical protein
MIRGNVVRDNDALSPFGRKAMEASGKQEAGQDARSQGSVKLGPLARQMAEQYQRETFSPLMLSGVMRMVEFGLVFLAGIASFLFYVGVRTHLVLYYPLIIIAGGALFVLLMEVNDGYQINVLRSPGGYLRRLFISWAAVLGTLAIAGFLLKSSSDFSRGWFLYWALSTACCWCSRVSSLPGKSSAGHETARWSAAPSSSVAVPMQKRSFARLNSSRTTTSASAASSMIVTTSVRHPLSRAIRNSAISTSLSNSPALRASTC